MTPIDPFERQLPAALTRLADPRTPDYLTDILGRTARTRQRSAWRSLERWLPMPSLTSPRAVGLLAVAALALALIGSALLGGGGGPAPGPTAAPSPTTSPVPSPSPSSSPGPLPDAVVGGWVAASRGTETEAASERSFLVFGSQQGSDAMFGVELLSRTSTLPATAGSMGVDELVLRSDNQKGGCTSGDTGRYRWIVSGDGQWLTMDLIDDECPVRAQIVPGTWQRSLAHASTGGPMIAALFDPMFTVTTPPAEYSGRGTAEQDTLVTETSTYTFKVWKDVDGFADPCDIDAGRIDLEGLDEVLAYFTDDPRFEVTRQEEFTIDGRRAVEIEILIGPNQTEPCWDFDGNASDKTGVLTFVPGAATDGFWNGKIGDPGLMVITEVDGVSLLMEPLTFDGELAVDRETLDTIRFVDGLPEPPAS